MGARGLGEGVGGGGGGAWWGEWFGIGRHVEVKISKPMPRVAIDLEGDRFAAVCAAPTGSGLSVDSWITAARPSGVDATDAAAVGAWIAEELKQGSMDKAARKWGVVFAVPRAEVVHKRLTFPAGTPASDVPAMVKLQMLRQLTVPAENALIDFVPMGAAADAKRATKAAPAGPVGVLAGALQSDRVDWRRAVAKAAGFKVGRVSLRCEGVGVLLAEAAQRRGGSTLGVSVSSGSVEFVILEDGQIVFARATDLVRPRRGEELEEFAERVGVEAKRTWMSYRVGAESVEVEAVAVGGDDRAAQLVASACSAATGLASAAAGYPAFIAPPSTMTAQDRTLVASLAGLLAGPVVGRGMMDFANPRKAPDLAGAKRQRVLLGALAAILVLGTVWTVAKFDLAARQRQLAGYKKRWDEVRKEYTTYQRLKARAEHAEIWKRERGDWLSHLLVLGERLPGPGEVMVDRIEGTGESAVDFSLPKGGERRYALGTWTGSFIGRITLQGRSRRPGALDAVRAAFVADDRYTIESRGAETPESFNWLLTSRQPRAVTPTPPPPPPQTPPPTPPEQPAAVPTTAPATAPGASPAAPAGAPANPAPADAGAATKSGGGA